MTKIEKEIVAAALSEYAFRHQKEAEKSSRAKDYDRAREEHAHANAACSILTYWPEVVEAPSGSVKI